MVGVRQFDEREAIEKIMQAFWREGYASTSIDDLVAATGLKRGSLYGAFGDKKAMFLKAYAHYVETMELSLMAILAGRPLKSALENFYASVIANLLDTSHPKGCLIAQTMSEAAGRGDEIEDAAIASFARAASAFEERFQQAKDAGELKPDVDVKRLARFFAGTNRGMAILYRLTGDISVASDIAHEALTRIDMASERLKVA